MPNPDPVEPTRSFVLVYVVVCCGAVAWMALLWALTTVFGAPEVGR